MMNYKNTYNVRDYGAIGDGETLETNAIQSAIDDCSKHSGGTVYFPNGEYLTGTVFLKDNVTLYLEISAVIKGSINIDHYSGKTHKQRYARESHMDRCLLFAENVENISIDGLGTIDGQGEKFPAPGTNDRPMLMRFMNSKNIRLTNIRLLNPASWTTAFILCDTIFADRLIIRSNANNNGDGLDFDCCTNVTVSNCNFSTSDDSICLQNSEKTGKCKNIVIQNCIMKSRWAAIRIGLLSSGDIEDVTVSNCIFCDNNCSGLKIQSTEGGVIKNMLFENIIMKNVSRPVFITFNHFRMGVDSPEIIPKTGEVNNLQFNNFRIENDGELGFIPNTGIVINGTPGYIIKDIIISNIQYTINGGGKSPQFQEVPEITGLRPEYFAFDGKLPSCCMYLRHVSDISLQNMKFELRNEDERHLIACDDACYIDISRLSVENFTGDTEILLLKDSSEIYVDKIKKVGDKTKIIKLLNGVGEVYLEGEKVL